MAAWHLEIMPCYNTPHQLMLRLRSHPCWRQRKLFSQKAAFLPSAGRALRRAASCAVPPQLSPEAAPAARWVAAAAKLREQTAVLGLCLPLGDAGDQQCWQRLGALLWCAIPDSTCSWAAHLLGVEGSRTWWEQAAEIPYSLRQLQMQRTPASMDQRDRSLVTALLTASLAYHSEKAGKFRHKKFRNPAAQAILDHYSFVSPRKGGPQSERPQRVQLDWRID